MGRNVLGFQLDIWVPVCRRVSLDSGARCLVP